MMILLRLLILGGVAFLLWRAWRLLRPAPHDPTAPRFERMIRCEVCEQHVPSSQAHEVDGHVYCLQHGPDDVDPPPP